MSEAELESSINEYKQQLCQVEAAIHCADSSMLDDLLKLQGDLKELINLSQESLHSFKNNAASQNQPGINSPSNTVDFDAEMALFQSEIASIDSEYQVTNAEVGNNLDKHLDQAESSKSKSNINTDLFSQPNHSENHLVKAESSKSKSNNNEDLFSQLLSMEGMKCRAIYSTEYGNLGYHNAVIHKIQLEKDIQSVEDVQVRVMFSHPCVLDMKPCSYYLDDRCNYGADRCKFSHGHIVPFTDIREYVEPNYNRLKAGGRCLVAATSGLWKPAVIQGREEGPDNETIFIVQLGQTNTTTTVTSSEILPLGSDDSSDEDSKEDDDDIIESKSWDESDTTNLPPPVRSINQTSIGFGSWEKHTKGIGSRLMEKMGYVHGQGLGKSGEGRLEPIEAVVLPQGKSLDKCMELKALSSNPVIALQKLKKKEKEQKRIAAGYHKQQKKYSVFDFLNKKLGDSKKDDDNQKLKNSKNKSVNLKTASDKSLNVQGLKLSQEIRDITINITKLQQSFQVNQTRDKVVASSIMKKIESQQNKLQQLKRAEGLLENEQANRTSKQKLTIF